MRSHITSFLRQAHIARTDFYNESTLQMELGMFLRQQLSQSRVFLERPITHFGTRESGTKKEIDIAITDGENQPLAAIEIKMPLNGRVPESMFDFCRDIHFCESLVRSGFKSAYALIYTHDRDFWQGSKVDGIYRFFRANIPINGEIAKPTGTKDREIKIDGRYSVVWQRELTPYGYAIIEVSQS